MRKMGGGGKGKGKGKGEGGMVTTVWRIDV